LRIFENRILRRIFGPRRQEVAGVWRRLHNKELHNLYASPDIIRVIKSKRMRWKKHVSHIGDMRNAYSILVGKPERKKPLGRTCRRWKNYIRVDLRDIGGEIVDWMHLGQDRDQWGGGHYEDGNEPSASGFGFWLAE
jgi:hypothetical protein